MRTVAIMAVLITPCLLADAAVRGTAVQKQQVVAETPSISLPCKIVGITDGDTVVVEVSTRFPVRLLDCWAPEKHETEHPREKPLGLKAKAAMEALATGKTGLLTVPLPGPDESLGKVMTLGRILGYVRIEAGDLSDLQVKAGQAYRTKEELEAVLK